MAMQLGALRTALLDAGASPATADKAAEEVAGYDSRQTAIDVRLEKLGGDVRLVQWMIGFVMAFTLMGLGATLTLSSRLGEISGQLARLRG